MVHKLTDNQKVVEYLGFGCSVLVGLLISLGQLQSLLLGIIAFLTLITILLGLRTLVDTPGIVGFWLLGAAILVVPWNAVRAAESITAADIFLVLSLPWVLYGVFDRARNFRIPWWLGTGVVLIATSVLLVEVLPSDLVTELVRTSTTFSDQDSSGSNLVTGMRLVFALAAFPLMAIYLVSDWSQVRMLVNLWIVGVGITCLVAVLDAFFGTGLQSSFTSNSGLEQGAFELGQTRYRGLTIHPIALSLAAAMVIPVLLFRMTAKRETILYLPLVLLSVAAILLSGSRTGVVLLVIVAIGMFIWIPKSRRVIVAAVVGFAALLLVTNLLGDPLWSPRLSGADSAVSESNDERLNLIRDGITNVVHRPLVGYGFENARTAHDLVLQLWLSGGIIALVGFYMVAVGYLREGLRVSRLVPVWLRGDLKGATFGFLLFLFAGFIGNYIFDRYLYVPVAIIMASAGLLTLRRRED